ncbi:MAG TPA: hypothetical protein VFW33_21055 [Gemmataceae bacterium]|nr:hypothetical protein [Gemmataceae bacterium]
MGPFKVGDRVIVRWGQWQGTEGQVIAKQRAEVYAVRLATGTVLYFGRASLLAAAERLSRTPEVVAWGRPSRN